MKHKIRDFPLVVPSIKPPPKEAPAKLEEGKKEKWTTIGCKGKAHLSPKYSYATIILVAPISIGAHTPTYVGM